MLTVAHLRLFAQAREAAGTNAAEFSGVTVAEVLQKAVSQFGQGFSDVVSMSKVWVNGEEVPLSHPVGDNDEVAVLPPVSGGM
jgi:molybdopterin converting factor small subunit